jgi:hypothetical protein
MRIKEIDIAFVNFDMCKCQDLGLKNFLSYIILCHHFQKSILCTNIM